MVAKPPVEDAASTAEPAIFQHDAAQTALDAFVAFRASIDSLVAQNKALKDDVSRLGALSLRVLGLMSRRHVMQNEALREDLEGVKLRNKALKTALSTSDGTQAVVDRLEREVKAKQAALEDFSKQSFALVVIDGDGAIVRCDLFRQGRGVAKV